MDSPGYWPPALDQFLDLKERFESKLQKRAEAIAVDLETTFSKMVNNPNKHTEREKIAVLVHVKL